MTARETTPQGQTTRRPTWLGPAAPARPAGDPAAPGADRAAAGGDGTSRADTELLRRAVEQHAAVLFRVAVSIVHDAALADDVVQETLIKAWRSAPLDADGRVPRAWLTKVARNTAISHLRRRREDPYEAETLVAATPDGAASPARTVEGRAQLADLRGALGRLDEEERLLIVLREVDGLSYEEIAQTLELPLPTVKTRLFRARQQLKHALGEWR